MCLLTKAFTVANGGESVYVCVRAHVCMRACVSHTHTHTHSLRGRERERRDWRLEIGDRRQETDTATQRETMRGSRHSLTPLASLMSVACRWLHWVQPVVARRGHHLGRCTLLPFLMQELWRRGEVAMVNIQFYKSVGPQGLFYIRIVKHI